MVISKKAAMFGLDARKMSVKKIALNVLFLANLRRLSFRLVGGDSYSYKSQIAAMFGLDARIALAIFGALSVITGAALYKAIGSAKSTQLLWQVKELEKAVIAYNLDTGVALKRYGESSSFVNYNRLDPRELLSSSQWGWKGPYFSAKRDMFKFDISDGWDLTMYVVQDKPVLGHVSKEDSLGRDFYCSKSSAEFCYLWIAASKAIENDAMAKELDTQLDGGDGDSAGNLRWYNTRTSVLHDEGDPNFVVIYFKTDVKFKNIK